MKRKIVCNIVLIIVVLTGIQRVAAQQKKASATVSKLRIGWEMITNNYQNKPQSRSCFWFTGISLPAKGWKIYFNFAREIIPASVTGDIQIRHINGDFFCLSPGINFKGLAAGESLQVQFTSTEWMVNRTDAPDGLYLVWDSAPNKTYPIALQIKPSDKPEQFTREPKDKVQVATPEVIYGKNKDIYNIAADSLIKVFPTPVSYQEVSGAFTFNTTVKIIADPAFAGEKAYLQQTLAGLLLPAKNINKTSAKAIVLQKKEMPLAAYELTVNTNQITIASSTSAR